MALRDFRVKLAHGLPAAGCSRVICGLQCILGIAEVPGKISSATQYYCSGCFAACDCLICVVLVAVMVWSCFVPYTWSSYIMRTISCNAFVCVSDEKLQRVTVKACPLAGCCPRLATTQEHNWHHVTLSCTPILSC